MIYDPITRQSVEIIGRLPPQATAFRFGQEVRGPFMFARVRYGEHLPGFSGGFAISHEREVDINDLVADDGTVEISRAYRAAPELVEA